MADGNPFINGSVIVVFMGVVLFILPWLVGIEGHILAKIGISFIGVIVFLTGLGSSKG